MGINLAKHNVSFQYGPPHSIQDVSTEDLGRCSADGSVRGGPTGCQAADHTVSGPAVGLAVQSLQTNSSDVLLPEECSAHACGCNLTWVGWYYWEGSFRNILVSLLVVVIYYIFILPLVPVLFHWQLQEAGFSLGRLHAPSISHTAAALRPCPRDGSAGGVPGLLDN